jgi:hypothetical protein
VSDRSTENPILTLEFQHQLESDLFVRIGWFGIKDSPNGYACEVHVDEEPGDWTLSIYSHVSFAGGGKHIRIGKAEGKLKERLNSWPYHIGGALKNDMISKNQQFAGSTPPWEAKGWLKYLVPYGGRGLLFARRGTDRAMLSPERLQDEKRALIQRETYFIVRYQPPLNNDRYSKAGLNLKASWIAERGPPTRIWRRK